jgi:hypothetical protein
MQSRSRINDPLNIHHSLLCCKTRRSRFRLLMNKTISSDLHDIFKMPHR